MKRPAFLLHHLLPLLLLWDAVGCAEDASEGVVTGGEGFVSPPTLRAEDASHGEVFGPKLGKAGIVT